MNELVTWLREQFEGDEDLVVEGRVGAQGEEGFDFRLRWLREVESKRAILDWHDAAWKNLDEHPDDLPGKGWLLAMEKVVRLLALPYADRPGYQEEWKP